MNILDFDLTEKGMFRSRNNPITKQIQQFLLMEKFNKHRKAFKITSDFDLFYPQQGLGKPNPHFKEKMLEERERFQMLWGAQRNFLFYNTHYINHYKNVCPRCGQATVGGVTKDLCPTCEKSIKQHSDTSRVLNHFESKS